MENRAKLQKRAKTDAFLKKGPVKLMTSGANKVAANVASHSSLILGQKVQIPVPVRQKQAER